MAATGSASGQPQFIASTGNRSFANAPLIEDSDTDQIVVPDVSFRFSEPSDKLFSLDDVIIAKKKKIKFIKIIAEN